MDNSREKAGSGRRAKNLAWLFLLEASANVMQGGWEAKTLSRALFQSHRAGPGKHAQSCQVGRVPVNTWTSGEGPGRAWNLGMRADRKQTGLSPPPSNNKEGEGVTATAKPWTFMSNHETNFKLDEVIFPHSREKRSIEKSTQFGLLSLWRHLLIY